MLKYFSDRKDVFSVDAISGNKFGLPEWTLEAQQKVLEFVDNIFIYQGERNWFDFIYTRSQSSYYQRLLKQQLPVDSDYAAPPGYVKFLRRQLIGQNYDFVWINNLDYAHLAASLDIPTVTTVIDMHDITSRFRLVRKNIAYSKHLSFDYETNFEREVRLLKRFSSVIIDSRYEWQIMSSHLPDKKLHFIPTVVDIPLSQAGVTPYKDRQFEYDILFVGAINQPNKDGLNFFLNAVFPEIIAHKPDVRFAIAGKISQEIDVADAVKANVYSPGYVPDLADLYLKSKLVICPLLTGAGTKFKLVEAMAYAMPIVTTTTCASALNLVDGINAFITDDASLYASYVMQLLNELTLAQQFSESVGGLFDAEHSKVAIYSKLNDLLGATSNYSSDLYA